MVVAVTGASGQLGQALKHISGNYPEITFYFATSAEADVTDTQSIASFFSKYKPDFCINAAAYTAVDKAESEPEKAHAVNVEGAKNIAETCLEYNTTLIHISTDFVFDGSKGAPYTENDIPNPQSVYGTTKLLGEEEIRKVLQKHFIIRTSWVYSQFGNNFMKTMLRLGWERDSITVVNDQTGTPTNAIDLAEALMIIVNNRNSDYGTYHYSNEGSCTWYDFAKKIFELNKITIDLQPIPTSAFPTPAKRPSYSVLDKSKIKQIFGIGIKCWESRIEKQ